MKRTNENIVSSYFYYMWNRWSKAECETVFGSMIGHFWEKWCDLSNDSLSGAAERFYAALDNNARQKIVERACELYDGAKPVSEKKKMKAKSTYANVAAPMIFRYGHGSMAIRMSAYRILPTTVMTFGAEHARSTAISFH